MIVIIDTREQNPLRFSDAVQVERGTMPLADYSIKGFEDQVAIERKSLGDLLGTITSGRERFIKELRGLRSYRFKALLIESDWPTILSGLYGVPSVVNPNSIIGSLMAFAIKYEVIPILAGDHATAGVLCERLLSNYVRMIEQEYKLAKAIFAAPKVGDSK